MMGTTQRLAALAMISNIVLLIAALSLSKFTRNYDEIVTISYAKAMKVPALLEILGFWY